MLRALFEAGIEPDMVLGTSVGALNGVAVAAEPSKVAVERLEALWSEVRATDVFAGSLLGRVVNLIRTGVSLHGIGELRRLVSDAVGADTRIESLPLPFQCVAARIEDATEHWFEMGPAVDAVMASCAVPGLLPPVKVGNHHFYDGGIVNSIPLSRAVAAGARTVYVLQVGRAGSMLEPPRRPWEVGLVAFEVARRHRFATDMSHIPSGVEVHVLPAGPPPSDLRSQLRYRDATSVADRLRRSYEATVDYLSHQQDRR